MKLPAEAKRTNCYAEYPEESLADWHRARGLYDEPAGGTWTAQVVARSDTRYRIDVRAAFDDGTGRRASAPWETLGAGETRRWRITYDPGDAESFALEAMPDVLLDGAKLSGILIETVAQEPGHTTVAIGIGVLIVGWIVYDLLCRTPLVDRTGAFTVVGFVLSVVVAYGHVRRPSGHPATSTAITAAATRTRSLTVTLGWGRRPCTGSRAMATTSSPPRIGRSTARRRSGAVGSSPCSASAITGGW